MEYSYLNCIWSDDRRSTFIFSSKNFYNSNQVIKKVSLNYMTKYVKFSLTLYVPEVCCFHAALPPTTYDNETRFREHFSNLCNLSVRFSTARLFMFAHDWTKRRPTCISLAKNAFISIHAIS
jgi:hypothetical protein